MSQNYLKQIKKNSPTLNHMMRMILSGGMRGLILLAKESLFRLKRNSKCWWFLNLRILMVSRGFRKYIQK